MPSLNRILTRRQLLRAFGVGAAGAFLAACAPAPAPTAAPQVVKETVEVVKEQTVVVKETAAAPAQATYSGELSVMVLKGPPVEPVCNFLAVALTSKYPGVKIKTEYLVGDLGEVAYTRAAAGTLDDVYFSADNWVVPFAKNGVSLDLKPFAEADKAVDLNDIFPAMLGLGSFNGQVHMLPSALDVVTMYYNKTLFEKAGADLPADTWTWDDFIAQAKKITALEKDTNGKPKYWGLSNATWNWWATVYPWIVGYGGKVKSDDGGTSTWSDPKTLEALTAYTELWTKHNIAQPLGLDVGGDAFQLGRAAVWTHIPGARQGVRDAVGDKFEWDVQLMPKMPDGKHRTGMGCWGLSVYSKSKMKEVAYEYLKYMITPAGQRLMASKDMGVPLLQSVAKDPSWMEGLQPPPKNLKAYVNGAQDAVLPVVDYPPDCGSFYAGVVCQAYQSALEAAIRGTKKLDQAFKECDATIQNCLQEHK